jgi:hypothetical protein
MRTPCFASVLSTPESHKTRDPNPPRPPSPKQASNGASTPDIPRRKPAPVPYPCRTRAVRVPRIDPRAPQLVKLLAVVQHVDHLGGGRRCRTTVRRSESGRLQVPSLDQHGSAAREDLSGTQQDSRS